MPKTPDMTRKNEARIRLIVLGLIFIGLAAVCHVIDPVKGSHLAYLRGLDVLLSIMTLVVGFLGGVCVLAGALDQDTDD